MLQKIESHDLSDNQLEESYWIVTHWKKIERLIVRTLIGINAVLFLFVFGFIVKTYAIDSSAYAALIESLKQVAAAENNFQLAEPLAIDSITVLPQRNGRADVSLRVTNPSDSFRARFDIAYISNGKEIGRTESFIYPGEDTYVLGLALPPAADVTAEISNIFWQRITAADVRTIAERKRFRVDDFSFRSADGVARATFTVANTSVHNYWGVRVPVLLLSGSIVSAVNSVTLDRLDSNEKKRVTVSWYETLSEPSSYIIKPEVDVFDESVYRSKTAPLQKLR